MTGNHSQHKSRVKYFQNEKQLLTRKIFILISCLASSITTFVVKAINGCRRSPKMTWLTIKTQLILINSRHYFRILREPIWTSTILRKLTQQLGHKVRNSYAYFEPPAMTIMGLYELIFRIWTFFQLMISEMSIF